jgi:hypothetical protein
MSESKQKKKVLKLTENEHVGDNITHLLKSGNITRSDSVDQYSDFSSQIPKVWRGMKLQYDLWYNSNNIDKKTNRSYITSFLYTDMLNKCLYFRVPSDKLNTEILETVLLNKHETIDPFVVHRIANNLADKYNLIPHQEEQFYDRVVFLPGTNILDDILDFNKVKDIVDNQGAKVKPHPLTSNYHLFMLRKQFGDANVLNSNASAFQYLLNAKVVFCCKNSEMGLSSLLLGKKMCLVQNEKYSGPCTYGSIYNTILNSQHYSARDALHKLLSSEYSGIIHMDDPRAVEKMYNFLNSYNLICKRT